MIFLFLQAVFSSFFALIIKWVGNRNRRGRKEDIFIIGAINYIVAALATVPEFLTNEIEHVDWGAVWTGSTMGAVYFIAYFFVIYLIKWVGVTATTVVTVLSILFPIVFAAFYWQEQPSGEQVTGIGLALVALILIGGKRGGQQQVSRPWFASIVMLVFFLLCGVSRLAQDAFGHVSVPQQRPTFLFTAFVIAAIPSIAMLVYLLGVRKQKLQVAEIALGVALGLSNILQSHFILKCLEYFPGYVVFPVTSAGAILITTLIATQLLDEKLSGRTYLGIVIAIVALVLLY